MYIQRFVRPDRDEQRRLISKQNALRTAQEEFATRSGSDIFDLGTVFVSDKDDYIVAKLLTKALERIFGGDLQSAEDEVQKARDLSPNYFEVQRVQAMVHIGLEDYFSAEAEYEAAISLASDRAPLRLWYAGFLSRNLGDNDRALGQLLKAEELAPNSAIIKLQCARILQYLRRLDDAEQRLNSIRDLDKLSAKTRRIHLDLSIQNDFRRAEDYSAQQQYQLALVCLESAREKVLNAPRALIDERTLAHIAHAKRHLPPLRWAFKGLDEEKRLAEIENWLFNPSGAATYINLEPSEELGAPSVGRAPHVGPQAELPNRGRLSHLHPNYGFVDTGATRLFFHRGAWVGKTDFLELGEGVIVEFDLGSNDRGECALNVHPITETTKRLAKGDMIHGAVKSLSNTFGFIKMDRGGDLFFHRSDCTPATKFRALAVGERVRCVFELDENGRRRGIRVEAFSGVPGPQPA
jgi:cold shock CspA family protein/tetratricopeptide (TPR) repeat protein